MIENIMIIDTETTGLSPEHGAKIIEVGAILYNVNHRAIIQMCSTLYPSETNEAEDINNINPAITNTKYSLTGAGIMLKDMALSAQAYVAHNAQFDKRFTEKCISSVISDHIPWICTKKDFQWPFKLFRSRLKDICESMSVNYVAAHRAMADCKFIADCFSKLGDLPERLERAMMKAQKYNGFAHKGNQYSQINQYNK